MDSNTGGSPLPPRKIMSEEVVTTTSSPVTTEPVAETNKYDLPLAENKFPWKIIFIFILIGLLAATGWWLYSYWKKGSGQPITLTYWGLWEEPAVLNGLIADFESKNPGIKIKYVKSQKTDYRTRLSGRLEKDPTTEEVPDIFRIHASWYPMFDNKLALVPEKTATSIGLDSDYYQTYKNTIKTKGQYWGIPLMYDSLSLFYNKDLLQAASVSVPRTWYDLQTAASKITVKDPNGQIKIAGAALGLVDNVDHWSDIVGLMMLQAKINPLETDPAKQKGLQDLLTFYSLFYTKYGVWSDNLPDSTTMFANGKLGFYFGPSWRVFNIEEMKTAKFEYAITSVPQLPTIANLAANAPVSDADLTNDHWATYWVESVNKASKHQKEAWMFLEFMSSKDSLEKMYKAASDMRMFGEIYPRVSMQAQAETNKLVEPFVRNADKASLWYLCSRTFDNGLNDSMSQYFGDAINSISRRGASSGEVMGTLVNGINQLVTKYKLQ